MRLISPDRKLVLLHKQLRDVASCVQGIKNPEHFGFICKENNVDFFVGYVFKCQSESVADDLVAGKTSFLFFIDGICYDEINPALQGESSYIYIYNSLLFY